MYGVFAREENNLASRGGEPAGANRACRVEATHSAGMIVLGLDRYTCIAVCAVKVVTLAASSTNCAVFAMVGFRFFRIVV